MTDNQFLREQAQALERLDMEWAIAQLPESRRPRDELGRFAVLAGLHKARYELAPVAAQSRHESREWLEKNGFTRFQNRPWPPKGVLP